MDWTEAVNYISACSTGVKRSRLTPCHVAMLVCFNKCLLLSVWSVLSVKWFVLCTANVMTFIGIQGKGRSLYANMYKHVYRDFTKDEKEYQDTICSKEEEGNGDRPWEVLYDYVVDPAASQPEWGDLWGVFTHKKNSPFGLSGVDDRWETYPSALTDTILCLKTISAALLVLSSVSEAILVRAKNSNGTTVRTFSNFNLLRGHCMLLPFPSALTSLCAPVSTHWQLAMQLGVQHSLKHTALILYTTLSLIGKWEYNHTFN